MDGTGDCWHWLERLVRLVWWREIGREEDEEVAREGQDRLIKVASPTKERLYGKIEVSQGERLVSQSVSQ